MAVCHSKSFQSHQSSHVGQTVSTRVVLKAAVSQCKEATSLRTSGVRVVCGNPCDYGPCSHQRWRLPDGGCYAGERASACALLEAAISNYEEAAGLKSAAVKSALRRAEQLLATLPDEDRQKVGSCCPRCARLAFTKCAGALKTPAHWPYESTRAAG